MLTAIAVWRQYPTAIEAELADRGHDIADWHRGRMSSRQLLTLLRHPRRDGAYEAALLDNEWPLWMLMIKEIHKEIALDRASKYVGTQYEYEPMVFQSVSERIAALEAEGDEFDPQAFNDLMSDVFAGPNDDQNDGGD